MKLSLMAALALTACTAGTQHRLARAEAVFPGDVRVSLEVAATPSERSRGLMFRESLAPTEGMIFLFDEPGPHGFWMKNTLIPLDMFWLEEDGRIVAILESVPPCEEDTSALDECPTYEPGQAASNAAYVIETVAGFAVKHDVEVGAVVEVTGLPEG